MPEAAISPLAMWENFYVIVGSAAAALTGLMFVVITLQTGAQRGSSGTVAAFSTPTVVHLGAALFIAAILSVPWQVIWNASLILGLAGVWGVIYVIIVVRRTRRQTEYQPVLEDWLWHIVFPFLSYIAFVVAAIVLLSNPAIALFIIGAATILLLFIGIHNAWDTVIYIAVDRLQLEHKDPN